LWLQPWLVFDFAAIFADLSYFTMTNLATTLSWQGSLTQVVTAAMAGIRLSEPVRDDHPVLVQM
jgi:hypothetical protein